MPIILDLPFQDKIISSSGSTMEGFDTTVIQYGGKISQTTFSGANQDSSQVEIFKVNWAAIEYATPAEVLGGKVDEVQAIRDFYKQMQMGYVRYKPFENPDTRIWKIVKNSLKIKNIAGCIFTATLNLEFQYNQ